MSISKIISALNAETNYKGIEYLTEWKGVKVFTFIPSTNNIVESGDASTTVYGEPIILLNKNAVRRIAAKLGGIINLQNLYVPMHEMGHIINGKSESAADYYAVKETLKEDAMDAIISQINVWYDLTDETKFASFWMNFCGHSNTNDVHKTSWRFALMKRAVANYKRANA